MPDGRKWGTAHCGNSPLLMFHPYGKNRLMQVINNFLTNAIKFTQKEASHSDTRYAIKCYTSMSQIRDAAFLPIKRFYIRTLRQIELFCTRHRIGAFHLPDNHRAHEWNDRSGIRGREGFYILVYHSLSTGPIERKKAEEFQPITVQKTN